jgi:hypothetical protein
VEICDRVLPVKGEGVVLRQNGGTWVCTCGVQGVEVAAEVRRDGFSWTRGRVSVERQLVSAQEFPAALEEARMKRQVEAMAAQGVGAAYGVRDGAKRAAKRLQELFKK